MKGVIRWMPIALVALLAAPLVARAGDVPLSAARQSSTVAAQGGLIAVLDSEHGELSDPAEAIDQLVGEMAQEPGFSTSSEGLKLVELPDGSLMVDLEGRFQSALVATRGADGTVSVRHVDALGLEAGEQADAGSASTDQGGER